VAEKRKVVPIADETLTLFDAAQEMADQQKLERPLSDLPDYSKRYCSSADEARGRILDYARSHVGVPEGKQPAANPGELTAARGSARWENGKATTGA
jgi:hypothetical protein